MYAVVSVTEHRNNPNYNVFIKEVFNNRQKYKVNTMGCIFSFKVNSLEECVELFKELSKTGVNPAYRICNTSCVLEPYEDY